MAANKQYSSAMHSTVRCIRSSHQARSKVLFGCMWHMGVVPPSVGRSPMCHQKIHHSPHSFSGFSRKRSPDMRLSPVKSLLPTLQRHPLLMVTIVVLRQALFPSLTNLAESQAPYFHDTGRAALRASGHLVTFLADSACGMKLLLRIVRCTPP